MGGGIYNRDLVRRLVFLGLVSLVCVCVCFEDWSIRW